LREIAARYYDVPLEQVGEVRGRSNGRARPAEEDLFRPEGMTKTQFAFQQAIDRFNEANWRDGVTNLAHAWFHAVTLGERVDEEVAAEMMREVVSPGWTPEAAE
jgi:hypothetical protein